MSVDGLIAGAVGGVARVVAFVALDVRGEGHAADAIEQDGGGFGGADLDFMLASAGGLDKSGGHVGRICEMERFGRCTANVLQEDVPAAGR